MKIRERGMAMKPDQCFVIVGAGLAGSKAVEELREVGFEGRVLLIGEEALRPYERPPLSKEYLRGEKQFDEIAVHQESFYREHDIELLSSVSAIDIDTSLFEIGLSSGERIHFDKLLLATGAEPRKLSVPGADLDGVYYLRNVKDADDLRGILNPSSQVVVIGAGWIGSEVAASARQLGADVAVVEQGSLPLERVLGAEVGRIYRDLHAEHGVNLRFGVGVEELQGSTRVEAVKLSDGTILPATAVVVGVGVLPRTDLAQKSGISTENGIVVDEHLETNIPGIFAAGDVARAFHPRYGTHIRLEHWSAALNQGPGAAHGMLGDPVTYDRTPYFYSDQYDFGMEYRGWAPNYDQVVFRGDVPGRAFIAFWLHHGRVAAAMNANIWDVGKPLESLIRSGKIVDPNRLVDLDLDLNELTNS